MALAATRIAGPVAMANGVDTTIYTVPASTTAIIRDIRVANVTAGAQTFRLSIGADATGTRLYGDVSVAANSTTPISCYIVLAAAELLKGQANAANALTITVSGVLLT